MELQQPVETVRISWAEKISGLWNDGKSDTRFTDGILKVAWKDEVHNFHVHKVLLAMHSPKFQKLFYDDKVLPTEWNDNTVEVMIVNYPPMVIKGMLEYTYTGFCNLDIAWEDVGGLIMASKEFGLGNVGNYIKDSIVSKLAPGEVINLFRDLTGDKSDSFVTETETPVEFRKEVLKIVYGYCCRNAFQVMRQESFKDLSLESLKVFIGSDYFYVRRELELFNGVDVWCKHSCKEQGLDANKYCNRRKVLCGGNDDGSGLGALKLIRFPVMVLEGNFDMFVDKKKGYLPSNLIDSIIMSSRSNSDTSSTDSSIFSRQRRLSPEKHSVEFEKHVEVVVNRIVDDLLKRTKMNVSDASNNNVISPKQPDVCDAVGDEINESTEDEPLGSSPTVSKTSNEVSNVASTKPVKASVYKYVPLEEIVEITDHHDNMKTPNVTSRPSSQNQSRSHSESSQASRFNRLTRKVDRSRPSVSLSSQSESYKRVAHEDIKVKVEETCAPSPSKISRTDFVYEMNPFELELSEDTSEKKEKICIKNKKLCFANFIESQCKRNPMLKTIKLLDVELTELCWNSKEQHFPSVRLPHLRKFELNAKGQGEKLDGFIKRWKSFSPEEFVFFFCDVDSPDMRLADLWDRNVSMDITLYGAKICTSTPTKGQLTLNYMKPQMPFLLNKLMLKNLSSLSLGNCMIPQEHWLPASSAKQLRELHLFCVTSLVVDEVLEKCSDSLEKLIIWPADVSSRATVISLKHLPRRLKYFAARNCAIRYVLEPESDPLNPFPYLEEMSLQDCTWDDLFIEEFRNLFPKLREAFVGGKYGTSHPKVLVTLLKMKSVKSIIMLQFKMDSLGEHRCFQDLKGNLKEWGVRTEWGLSNFLLHPDEEDVENWDLKNVKSQKIPRLLYERFELEKFYEYGLWNEIYEENFSI